MKTRLAPMLVATLATTLAGGGGCTPGPVGVASLPTDTLTNGLLAHWTFDEGLGLTVNDSSGNGRDGSIFGSNSNWEPQGKFGGALHFGGADQVTVPGFPQATPTFTVSAWLDVATTDLGPNVQSLGALLSNETLNGGWGTYLSMPTPPPGGPGGDPSYDFVYNVGPPQNYAHNQCTCFTTDSWIHLAWVVDAPAGLLTLYVNGTPQTVIDVPRAIAPGGTTLFMGRWPAPVLGPQRFLVGALDDIAIWTRALAREEIGLLGVAPAPSRI
jgi:hypothetical protein